MLLSHNKIVATTSQDKEDTISDSKLEILKAILLGLCIGDSLSAPTQNRRSSTLAKLIPEQPNQTQWPLNFATGGSSVAFAGCGSDETEITLLLLHSLQNSYNKWQSFTKQEVWSELVQNLIHWMNNDPCEVGRATLPSLIFSNFIHQSKSSSDRLSWMNGAKLLYNRHDRLHNQANGSLARNAAIAVVAHSLSEADAIAMSINQSICTHFDPICVLCCVVQTILLRKAIDCQCKGMAPPVVNSKMIKSILDNEWYNFISKSISEWPSCVEWYQQVGEEAVKNAQEEFERVVLPFENFDPFHFHFDTTTSISATATLKTALWTLYWSQQEETISKIPIWFQNEKKWIFEKRGFESLIWATLCGQDSPSYASVAGSLLAAFHGYKSIPETYLNGLASETICKLEQK